MEVAGTVLAVLPVLLSALETAKRLGVPLTSQRRDLALVIQTLATQQLVLENMLSVVLDEALGPRRDNIQGSNRVDLRKIDWLDPDVNKRLKAFLGADYNLFNDILVNYQDSLMKTVSRFERITGTRLRDGSLNDAPSKLSAVNVWRLRSTRVELESEMHRQSRLRAVLETLILSKQKVFIADDLGAIFEQWETRRRAGGDTESIWSVETEALRDDRTLPYISVTLFSSSEERVVRVQQNALLDTGASASCISEGLAEELGLPRIPSDDELWTASGDQRLVHHGITKVQFTWTNSDGEIQRAKVEMFRILTLAEPVILSNTFIQSHHDVWSVAHDVVATFERVAMLGWSRLKKTDRAAEAARQHSAAQQNHVKEEQRLEAERMLWQGQVGTDTSLPPAAAVHLTTSSTSTNVSSTTSGGSG